jgi:hypothetical protein
MNRSCHNYTLQKNLPQDAFSDLAIDLRLIEPDPSGWSWWVGDLLEQMEMQADKRGHIKQYEYTLEVVGEKI